MADDRIIARLEEQLRDAHAANAELRERLAAADRRVSEASAVKAASNEAIAQFEKACARQKAAEDRAAVSQRKRADAERAARKLEVANEELRVQLAKVFSDVARLEELNEKVKQAQHVGDLIALEGS
jgi:PAB1-binding protein PBP1